MSVGYQGDSWRRVGFPCSSTNPFTAWFYYCGLYTPFVLLQQAKSPMPVFIRNVGSSFLTQSRLTDSIIYGQLSGLFRELGLVAIAVAELSSASRRNLIVIFGPLLGML